MSKTLNKESGPMSEVV